MNTVIVTGIAGYIGGQVGLKLKAQGHQVIGVDVEPLPAHLEGQFDWFQQCDFDSAFFDRLMMEGQPDAIVHCAGTSLVGPSMMDPQLYYNNNVLKTVRLLDKIKDKFTWKPRLIFSSSAATYGTPVMTPCQEVDPCEPISPYGESKLFIEWALESYRRAYGQEYVAFRFFNACSADPQVRHGQAPGATHIIARVLESIRDDTDFLIYGNNYETADGTCIRDYIHVDDLAEAHCRAIGQAIPSGVYNLGTNNGASNMEIVRMAEKITGRNITISFGGKRAGDPAVLTADATKFTQTAAWAPKYNLEDMIQHAWNWYTR
jgi:UDP-glucose 4-epimerase